VRCPAARLPCHPGRSHPSSPGGGRLISVLETAARLGVKPTWLYRTPASFIRQTSFAKGASVLGGRTTALAGGPEACALKLSRGGCDFVPAESGAVLLLGVATGQRGTGGLPTEPAGAPAAAGELPVAKGEQRASRCSVRVTEERHSRDRRSRTLASFASSSEISCSMSAIFRSPSSIHSSTR